MVNSNDQEQRDTEASRIAIPEDTHGPYVTVATFCERVLEEKDNVLSAIRIIDTLNLHEPAFPGDEGGPDSLPASVSYLLVLKAGDHIGAHTVRLVFIGPGGQVLIHTEREIEFKAPEHGMQVITNLSLQISREGLSWMEVRLGKRLMTRTPFRVNFARPVKRLPDE